MVKPRHVVAGLLVGYVLGFGTFYRSSPWIDLEDLTYQLIVDRSSLTSARGLNSENFERLYLEEVSGNTSPKLRKYFIDRFLEENEGIIYVRDKSLFGRSTWKKYESGQKVNYRNFEFWLTFGTGSWIDITEDGAQGKKLEYRSV